MAAPTPVTRQLPTGYKMPDGFQSEFALTNKPAISLWEKSVKPASIDTGDMIDTSTMLNNKYRTKWFKKLLTIGEMTVVCAYDPAVITDIVGQAGVNQAVTQTFADGSSWTFWGGIAKAEFGDLKEGEFPEVTLTIGITNWDHTTKTEAGPVFSDSAGT